MYVSIYSSLHNVSYKILADSSYETSTIAFRTGFTRINCLCDTWNKLFILFGWFIIVPDCSCRLPLSCFTLNQLMLSSGYGKLRPRLSHVSALLPPFQYVLQLCKLCASRFLLCSLSKPFHISLHTNRNTETQPIPIPATADPFHVGLSLSCSWSISTFSGI